MSDSDSRIHTDWIELEGGPRAWLARPEQGHSAPGICLFIEAFGVNGHMRNVAEDFARIGYVAIIPDIYHGETFDYGDMDGALGAIRQLDEKQAMREAGLAIDHLTAEGVAGKPAVAGYCLGGRLAFRAGLELGDRLSAVIAYYGGGIAPEEDRFGREPLASRAAEMGAPILLQYGSEDGSITPAEHGRIAAALSGAKKRYEMSVYPGAGHGFDCRERESYHPGAAGEAWRLTLQFLEAQNRA